MQAELLLNTIQTPLSKVKIVELAKLVAAGGCTVKALIDLSFHPHEQTAFRAAWVLENVYSNYLPVFLPELQYFLHRFPDQNNLSARRHYVKILALLTNKNAGAAIKEVITAYPTDGLVETVFSWLIDEKVPVAVKSHCLNILANLNHKHSWIKDELLQTMDFLVDQESIAFFAKVKQIRKQLA